MRPLRRVIEEIVIAARQVKWLGVTPVDTVIAAHRSAVSPIYSSKICIFSTFDSHSVIDQTVIRYLRELRGHGFDIVLVSTSASIAPSQIDELLTLCRTVVLRKNIGLDFASWSAGMALTPDIRIYKELLLANDSVFGPIGSLKTVLDRIQSSQKNVIGLTDSFEIEPHLQSYFLFIKSTFFNSELFWKFFSKISPLAAKPKIIKYYEVGFSRFCREQQITYEALFPSTELAAAAIRSDHEFSERCGGDLKALNPTLHLWDILFNEFGFPFIKTEILKLNRIFIKELSRWESMVASRKGGGEWVTLIKAHVTRIGMDKKIIK